MLVCQYPYRLHGRYVLAGKNPSLYDCWTIAMGLLGMCGAQKRARAAELHSPPSASLPFRPCPLPFRPLFVPLILDGRSGRGTGALPVPLPRTVPAETPNEGRDRRRCILCHLISLDKRALHDHHEGGALHDKHHEGAPTMRVRTQELLPPRETASIRYRSNRWLLKSHVRQAHGQYSGVTVAERSDLPMENAGRSKYLGEDWLIAVANLLLIELVESRLFLLVLN